MSVPYQELKETIELISTKNKGILAADESIGTIGKRFTKINLESTYESRRSYRELLFSTPSIEKYISAVILFDETLRQATDEGIPFPQFLKNKNIITGIKVDKGTIPIPMYPGENITEGIDNLRERLTEYKKFGIRFAKWRAVIKIGKEIPTEYGIKSNAHLMAQYASICQVLGIVPIVEPEVLMDGIHTIEQCQIATEATLEAVFHMLFKADVQIDSILLKPNMVLPGKDSSQKLSPEQIAEKTLKTLSQIIPSAVPVIAFLSGGQSPIEATQNLNAISSNATLKKPWFLTFSFSRALQEQPLAAWGGKAENKKIAQELFLHRLKCNSAAQQGQYNESVESS